MFKKIIVLSLITISLTSCMNDDIDNKKEEVNNNENIEFTDEDLKIVENILQINE